MKYQRGVSLSGLLVWAVIIVFAALLGMKVMPSVLEYQKIMKDSKAAVAQAGAGATVADVKKAYSRFAEIDQVDLPADELDISKEGGQLVISFAYERRIPLFHNVSLIIDYKGSTNTPGKE